MSRAAVLLLRLGLGLGLALGACGRKGPPVAPELVQPEPPESLAAAATPAGVRLTWNRPDRYSGGKHMDDLGSFAIERAPADGGAAFTRIGTLELEDQQRFRKERHLEWVDHDAKPGVRYLYRVIAVTLDRYQSRPAGPVAVQMGPAGAASPAEEGS